MTVTNAAQVLGISPSMAHRLLQSLLQVGLVEQTDDKAYVAGPAVLGLAQPYLDRLDVRTYARPIIEQMQALTHETACTLIRSGLHRVVVDFVLSSERLAYVPKLGEPLPLTTGATGRALLAMLPSQERSQLISEWYLSRDESTRSVPQAELNDLIDEGLEAGYFVSVSERIEGMSGIAIPLRDPVSSGHAVVSVVGPATRWRPDQDPDMCGQLARLAAQTWTSSRSDGEVRE